MTKNAKDLKLEEIDTGNYNCIGNSPRDNSSSCLVD